MFKPVKYTFRITPVKNTILIVISQTKELNARNKEEYLTDQQEGNGIYMTMGLSSEKEHETIQTFNILSETNQDMFLRYHLSSNARNSIATH